jgi:hypothetical protein
MSNSIDFADVRAVLMLQREVMVKPEELILVGQRYQMFERAMILAQMDYCASKPNRPG